MSDSYIALITANRITDIKKITTANNYNTNILYCEEERLTDRTNNKYPRVKLCGPDITIEPSHTQGDKYELEYWAVYQNQLDDSGASDDPVVYQTRNVASDIIKGWMDDHTCGGYAVTTYPFEAYCTIDEGPNGEPLFSVVVKFKVEAYLDKFDPYTLG